jgi:hydrogenase expression/formation protein HypC
MCLGVPGKVIETFEEYDILMGKVSFDGVVKKVCLAHVTEVELGEYVLVHVGFALSIIDESHAREVFELLDSLKIPSELGEMEGST